MALGEGGVFSIIKFVGEPPLAGVSGAAGGTGVGRFGRFKGTFDGSLGSKGILGRARGIASGGMTSGVSLVSLCKPFS